jgi:hypothetical protein
MNHRGMLVLIALTGLVVTPLNAAEAYRLPPNGITSWLAQESNPATQTQSTKSGANDVIKSGPDVTPPVLIHSAQPKLSKAIRKSNVRGNVRVNLFVEADGKPNNVHAVHIELFDGNGKPIPAPESTPEGLDLSKTAVDAVNRYRFKPAMKNSKPVKVELNVEVNFQSM